VWAVHPVLTESVTNIVGRADLLAGMTSLGGLLMYLRSVEASGRRRFAWLAGLMAVTAVGVFCKESAVAVLGMIALYEATWWNRRRMRGFLLGCLAMSPAFLAMWWMRARVMAGSAPVRFPFVDNPIMGADVLTGRLTAVKVLAKYLGLLVWPAHLSVDYSYRQIPLADGSLADWMAWLVVGAVAIACAFLYRRQKTAFFAAGFAFLTLLPASNLLIPMGTIMAERLLYLPSIGFAICLVLALESIGQHSIGQRARVRPLTPFLLGLLITAGLGARTWKRNIDWRDNVTLWSAAVQTSPLSFKAHLGLAHAMSEERFDIDEVIAEDERSLAILDSLPDSLNDAEVYFATGSQYVLKEYRLLQPGPEGTPIAPPETMAGFQRARTLLLRSLSIGEAHLKAEAAKGPDVPGETGDPKLIDRDADARAYLMLSEADQLLGNMDESLHAARQAQILGPARSEMYGRLHDVLLAAGREDEAKAVLMKGYLLTSDTELQRKLVGDYADHSGEAACAISYAQLAPAIDASCGIVRKQACLVSAEVVGLALKTGGRDKAARLKHELAAKYGCS
jgi:protein O-mannosyl-transferase